MALVTKGWLTAYPVRSRPHSPEGAFVEIWAPRELLDREFTTLRIKKALSGDYQFVYLGQEDLASVLPPLAIAADAATRQKVAMSYMKSLDDSALLQFLGDLLDQRERTR